VEDIEQDLRTDLLDRLRDYDPRRAKRSTFVRRVVDHRVASLLEWRNAGMRDPRRCRASLQDELAGDDGAPLQRGDTLDAEAYLHQDAGTFRDSQARRDLELDLRAALAALPPDLRTLCGRLARASIADVARETGLTRASLCRRIARIRAAFERHGLGAYFESPPGHSGRPSGT